MVGGLARSQNEVTESPVETGKTTSIWLADLVAGVSMAGLLLPEGVAYSGIAGLPPQAGVLGLFAGLLVYGLLGKSRFAIVSATSSSAAVLGATTLSIAGTDSALRAALAAGLVIATGIGFLLAGAARLGAICSFISKPVLRGFSFGLAITIVVKQLPKVTGIHPSANALFFFVEQLLAGLSHWNWVGIAMGTGALASFKLLARWHKIPGALLVIAAGIAIGQWVDIRAYGVSLVGPINLSIAAPTVPDLSRSQWLTLSELALAMVLLLFAESYGAIRGMALKHGDAISPNRDLYAFGVANLVSGLFHGMPIGAGFSATAANEAAGAMSGKSAWIAAAVVLVLVGLFLPLIELTPEPILAAVVIHAVAHTLTLDVFRPYFVWRRDRVVVVTSTLAVLCFGVLDGLLVGIGISLAMTLRGLSEPLVSELGRMGEGHDFLSRSGHADVLLLPGLLIVRPEAPLFFANVERVLVDIRSRIAAAKPYGVVLSMEESGDLDGTSVEALVDFANEQAAEDVALVLTRLKDPVFALMQISLGASTVTRLEAGSVDDAVTLLAHEMALQKSVSD